MENLTYSFRETPRIKKCDELELAKEKKGHFLYRLFCPNEIF